MNLWRECYRSLARNIKSGDIDYNVGKKVEKQQGRSFVSISYRGKTFDGNNQQVLIEQLEMQGFKIPYFCRAGICGSCSMILVTGKLKALKQDAIQAGGAILTCSCIPASNIELE